MSGRAAKQSYLGRVIAPAKFHDGHNNSKPYLSFAVFVDRLATKAEDRKERTSGKIYCSYSIQNENDPVAVILCNIIDSKTGQGGLGGHTYKSVEVWVEGSEKLAEVAAFDANGQNLSGVYYKSLEYSSVQILDKNLVRLAKGDNSEAASGEETSAPAPSSFSQPNVAPSARPAAAKPSGQVARPQAAATSSKSAVEVGSRTEHGGVVYEFLGGDPKNMSCWAVVDSEGDAPVSPVATPEKKVAANPFGAQKANPFAGNTMAKKPTQSSVMSMLETDGVVEDAPMFGKSTESPV